MSPAWHPSGTAGQAPALEEFDAIWDTGATGSVITQAVVDACGLAPTGIVEVRGVHGEQRAESFLVNIALPNNVVFTGVRVTKGILGEANLLIGMDIIVQGDFSVTSCNGFTQFSFRTPSIEHIDYVGQAKREKLQRYNPSENRAARRRAARGR